jgi:hypothetical protein
MKEQSEVLHSSHEQDIEITDEQYARWEASGFDPRVLQEMFVKEYPGMEALDSTRIRTHIRLFIEAILKKSPVPFTQEVTREAIKFILRNSGKERTDFDGSLYSGEVEAAFTDDDAILVDFFKTYGKNRSIAKDNDYREDVY